MLPFAPSLFSAEPECDSAPTPDARSDPSQPHRRSATRLVGFVSLSTTERDSQARDLSTDTQKIVEEGPALGHAVGIADGEDHVSGHFAYPSAFRQPAAVSISRNGDASRMPGKDPSPWAIMYVGRYWGGPNADSIVQTPRSRLPSPTSARNASM